LILDALLGGFLCTVTRVFLVQSLAGTDVEALTDDIGIGVESN